MSSHHTVVPSSRTFIRLPLLQYCSRYLVGRNHICRIDATNTVPARRKRYGPTEDDLPSLGHTNGRGLAGMHPFRNIFVVITICMSRLRRGIQNCQIMYPSASFRNHLCVISSLLPVQMPSTFSANVSFMNLASVYPRETSVRYFFNVSPPDFSLNFVSGLESPIFLRPPIPHPSPKAAQMFNGSNKTLGRC